MAEEKENVVEEIQQKESVLPQEEHKAQAAEDTQTELKKEESNSKEYNFKQLRETNKRLEDQLKSYEEKLRSLEDKSDELELSEDDLVEGKHFNKFAQKIEGLIRQKELQEVPEKLKGKFSDFDEVVTEKNLEKLKHNEPELYYTIRSGNDIKTLSAKDLFSKGVAAYKAVKTLLKDEDMKKYDKQKEQVHSNHGKPVSAQAIKGQGALHEANAFANGLTPELKKQLQKEMVEAIKAR